MSKTNVFKETKPLVSIWVGGSISNSSLLFELMVSLGSSQHLKIKYF